MGKNCATCIGVRSKREFFDIYVRCIGAKFYNVQCIGTMSTQKYWIYIGGFRFCDVYKTVNA